VPIAEAIGNNLSKGFEEKKVNPEKQRNMSPANPRTIFLSYVLLYFEKYENKEIQIDKIKIKSSIEPSCPPHKAANLK
jgi:hypothetical protein